MQMFFLKKNRTKSVYIHSIYTVYVSKMHFMAFILWLSYGYGMGILWYA